MLKAEQIDQINLVSWFHHQFPELADDLHCFANERKCSIQTGVILRKMGVKKGVADLFLAVPLNGKAGLWLELKAGKNKPTKEQIAFALRKKQRHYEFAFVWGLDAAKEMILTYLEYYLATKDMAMIIKL